MIELHGIGKTYSHSSSRAPALTDISLHIRPGEIVSLAGPSGSGKSTLINLIGCLDTATSGTYALDGKLVNTTSESILAQIRNKQIGLIFQNSNLLPTLNVMDNVQLPTRYGDRGSATASRATDVIELLNLTEKQTFYPHQLTPLEQQELAIARALVNQPSVLLADEPTGNLDSSSSNAILGTLQQLNEELGITVLIATHDQAVAVCTRRVISIGDGLLVSDKVVIQTRLERSH